jgi:deoxyribodipyrimidine photo-lyase
VPELAKLKGKQLYDPHGTLSAAEFKRLGYPAPIVDHAKARLRALARFKVRFVLLRLPCCLFQR